MLFSNSEEWSTLALCRKPHRHKPSRDGDRLFTLIYAYVTLIQRDAISHTDVGFVKSLTWAPVISNFHAAGDRRFIGARTALDRPVGDPY